MNIKPLLQFSLLLIPYIGISQTVNSKQLGQITISPGGVSNGKMSANCGQIVTLYSASTKTAVEPKNDPSFQVSLYPNPATQVINIQNNDPNISSFSIRVYDMKGNLVLMGLNTSEKIYRLSVAALSQGIYSVEVYSLAGQAIKNFKFSKV